MTISRIIVLESVVKNVEFTIDGKKDCIFEDLYMLLVSNSSVRTSLKLVGSINSMLIPTDLSQP